MHGAPANGRPRTGRDGWIVLTVQDHGPGIPRPDRKRVFDRFQRGAAATGNDIPGLGLGLSIVRQFALGAGGSIDYDETPGGGATFTLRLPRVDGRGVPAGRGPGCTPDGNDEPGTDGEPAGSRTPGENRDA